jgi:hypothetical protein
MRRLPLGLFLFLALAALAGRAALADDDALIGITWDGSVLVSFNPRTGKTLERHLQMNPHEVFRGLAYDPNHHRLYALAQGTHDLYWVDTQTLQIVPVGNLHIAVQAPGRSAEAAALAYDPYGDTLYTAVEHWDGPDYANLWSEICTVDPSSADLQCHGRIDGPFIDDLGFDASSGRLHGLALYGPGPWDSSTKAQVVRILPKTGEMEKLFETPYHTVMGLVPAGPFAFYAWLNWTSHTYGRIDLLSDTVTDLGSSDRVGVIAAMERKDFPLPSAPLNTEPAPASFAFQGHVTAVRDPDGYLDRGKGRGRWFRGRFVYDATAPYRRVDPNLSLPYGLAVRVYNLLGSGAFLRVAVKDNNFDPGARRVTDEFSLVAVDRARQVTVSWTLSDTTATALSGDDLLPAEFDLSRWQRNTFVISGGGPRWEEAPRYSITGTVDSISAGGFDPVPLDPLREGGRKVFDLPDGGWRYDRPLPPRR